MILSLFCLGPHYFMIGACKLGSRNICRTAAEHMLLSSENLQCISREFSIHAKTFFETPRQNLDISVPSRHSDVGRRGASDDRQASLPAEYTVKTLQRISSQYEGCASYCEGF